MLTSPIFDGALTPHGFFGRQGGVSRSLYASLNCGLGSGDAPDSVRENRTRVLRQIGAPADALATVHQVHSADCVVLDAVPADRPKADALVTDRPGLFLGILTADCAPVLFAGRRADGHPVIGAAHAGWRGALGGVLESTVAAMEKLGARRGTIEAVIGPCIGPRSYEVQLDFLAPFLAEDAENIGHFTARSDSFLFDLPAYAAKRLRKIGILADWCRVDTFAEQDSYFSYRRTTHRGETDYGRQLSVIGITR